MKDASKFVIWRTCLQLLALFNTCLTLVLLSNYGRLSEPGLSSGKAMQLLGLPYVLQTSWRCIFVSEYVHRHTITNHPLNSVLVARLLAALGEFCFGVQLALRLYVACKATGAFSEDLLRSVLLFLVLLDAIGQCCATGATVVGGANLPFLFEGVAWTLIFAISWGLSGAAVVLGHGDPFFVLVVAVTTPGILYMACGYCPMCWRSWRQERNSAQGSGADRKPVAQQVWVALTTRVPTQQWSVWEGEWLWQTLYFTIGTWSSLGLMVYPLRT